ncbi:MAG: manganese catalase family protein [Tannerellaceae bacterium]|nr:manganese catalase family protein [Tannerellaceae bacterium]
MFYHSKELQYNARVTKPDPRFARLLLEQFGGGNGELKAAMQYFVQAFSCRNAYPDKYDMLMDIATEEFSHLEIVGATIQMLLTGINGELKNTMEDMEMMDFLDGKASKENYIHQALYNPQFCVLTGGGPSVTDSNGTPWSGAYVNANGDLTVDLRSNIAAESRAKIVYEYLIKFTDDEYVKDTLRFLMTREITHFQQFEAALETIQPNFPPGIMQGDPKYSNLYFNMSPEEDATGPWNQGPSSRLGEEWQKIDQPQTFVEETNGLIDLQPTGTERTEDAVRNLERELGRARSKEVKGANPTENMQWSKKFGRDNTDCDVIE